MIRAAHLSDVSRIAEIVNHHAGNGRMLFKSHAQLYETIRDYGVYVDEHDTVIGCVAVGIIWADLAEIRALAVADGHLGKGYGKSLVNWCIAEARRLRIRKLMALTYEQAFFARLGFVVVAKESLPLKVWTDCVKCPKNDACDEIAMVHVLEDVAPPLVPEAEPTPRGVSVPVLPWVMEDD